MVHAKPVVSLYRSWIFPAISPAPALCYTADRSSFPSAAQRLRR